MPTRRSFLATGLATTSVAIAGCSGILGSDGGESGTALTTALAGGVDLGADIDGADAEVSSSSSFALRIDPGAYGSAAAQLPSNEPDDWMGHASSYLAPVTYSTERPDSVVVGNIMPYFEELGFAEVRYGVVRGGATGDSIRSELNASGSPDETLEGFELYHGERSAWAVSGSDLVGVPIAAFRGGDDPDVSNSALKAAALRRLVRIVSGERNPTEHATAAMDAVDHDDFLGVSHEHGTSSTNAPPKADVFAYGLGADEVTFQMAVAAPDHRAFDVVWDAGELRNDLTNRPLARGRSSDVITDGPTVSTDGTLGQGSVTLPTSDAFIVVG